MLVDLDRDTDESRLQPAGWGSAAPCTWPPNGSGSHYEFQTSLLHHQPRPATVEAQPRAEVVRGHLGIEDSLHRRLGTIRVDRRRVHTSPAGHCPELPDRLATEIPALRANPTVPQDGRAESRPIQTVLGILTILSTFWTRGPVRAPHTGTRPCRHLAPTLPGTRSVMNGRRFPPPAQTTHTHQHP